MRKYGHVVITVVYANFFTPVYKPFLLHQVSLYNTVQYMWCESPLHIFYSSKSSSNTSWNFNSILQVWLLV